MGDHLGRQKGQTGTPDRQTNGQADRRGGGAAALAGQELDLPCLLCPEKFRATAATRLWSRVIGGAGCCPACSKSRLPHHRFSPNFFQETQDVTLICQACQDPELPAGLGAVQRPMGPLGRQNVWTMDKPKRG